jgi:hypothetical protein
MIILVGKTNDFTDSKSEIEFLESEIQSLRASLQASENSRKQLQLEIEMIQNSRTYKYGLLLRDKLLPVVPLANKALYLRNKSNFRVKTAEYYLRKLAFHFLPLRLIRLAALLKLWMSGFRKEFVRLDKNLVFKELESEHNKFRGLADEEQYQYLSTKNNTNLEWLNKNISLSLLAKSRVEIQERVMPRKVARIYIDCRALEHIALRERGVGEISKNLIREIIQRFPKCSIILIVNSLDSNVGFDSLTAISVSQLKFETIDDEKSIFINLSPMTENSMDVSLFLLNSHVYKISLFYDLIPSHFPNRYLKGKERLFYNARFLCLEYYDEIWSISKSVELELKTYFPAKKIITRLPNGVLELKINHSPKANIIVFIGGGDPRKNNWYAISSILEFCKKEDYYLVILGLHGLRDNLNFFFSRYSKYFRIEDRVSESEKFHLISTSKILVCASLDEGLSLPPIEGVLSNTVVVASDIAVHENTLGRGFWLFDPWSFMGLRKSLKKVSRNLADVQTLQKTSYGRNEVQNYFE